MGYALTSFLCHVEGSTELDEQEVRSSLLEIIESRYIEQWTDDNNWYSAVLAIGSDGRLIWLDAEHPKDELFGKLEAMPAEQRFDAARMLAFNELIDQLSRFLPEDEIRRLRGRSGDEAAVTSYLERDLPAVIALQYGGLAAGNVLASHQEWCRSKLVGLFELWRKSEVEPFSEELRSPYSYYPAYDLCWGFESNWREQIEPDHLIALYSIHT